MRYYYKIVKINKKIPTSYTNGLLPKKYILTYIENTIVEAPKDTLGIFCFKRKMDAQNAFDVYDNLKILKVKPLSKGKTPKLICFRLSEVGLFIKNQLECTPPKGTICFHKIEVLNEVRFR